MKFRLDGVEQMKEKLRDFARKFPDSVARALYLEGQIEMTEAKRRTPVWNPARKVPKGHVPGSLRASGFVHEPKREGRRISVELSFGGPSVDYAVYVHEDPDAHHATGQWKFLESVLNESAPYMAARLAVRLDFAKVS